MEERIRQLLSLLQNEAVFRYGLMAAVGAIIVLHFVGPELELDWPLVGLFALILLIYYFPSITHLALPGNIEMDREIDLAEELVGKGAAEAVAARDESGTNDQTTEEAPSGYVEESIEIREKLLGIFKVSPQAAAMEIGRLLEESLVDLSSLYVPQSQQRFEPVPRRITTLLQREVIDANAASATNEVWQLRNRAVHGHAVSDDEVVRILDLGIQVVQILKAAIRRNWQVSAPRPSLSAVSPEQTVQVGLRRKFGKPNETYYFSCAVTDPNGSRTSASAFVQADQWAYLKYPDAFPAGSTSSLGRYKVEYEIGTILIALDSFEVEPSR